MASHSSAVVPEPVNVTPELLAQHGITAEEYQRILGALGRTPSITELGIYSVMWSEHCSYKSSRVHLKRLPTKSDRVVQGPGENAGIIDVGDGWACAFKIESHNHPSYIEPFQGAATGVGGILRDIFTMGARPLAVMDSLRFGPIADEGCPTLEADSVKESPVRVGSDAEERRQLIHRNHAIAEGVVSGIAGYGNCFGVPNLGGETKFEPCYSGNPLVNAFALGLVRKDEIFYAKASGTGNPVIYVGAKTGRDGIHGATMASEEFKEGSEQKRPNVQVGDPFMEKLLLEACLEAMKTGAIVGIQDMGAAGLTCSTCEMGARGGVGLDVELDLVPQRESGMSAYDIMLSESQERMLLVAEKGREEEVLRVFSKWGLDAVIVGTVQPEPRLRIRHHGVLVADIPNVSLTDDAPLYHRPIGTWPSPVPHDPPEEILASLDQDRDYTADLKSLLASANVCSKRWVHEQYDSMVQTNTVQGPGGEAGVMRIKGTGSRDQGTGVREQGTGVRDQGTGVRDQGTGVRDQGSGNTQDSAALKGHDSARTENSAALKGRDSARTENSAVLKGHDFSRAEKAQKEKGALAPEASYERGLAMALDGNGRWCWLNPRLGAMHAVAEAARKVACTGATPVAATNCLNFGNPEKPEIMAQLSAAIDGIAEACTALGTPITGGNVSLYNETRGVGIYPTPVLGIVGILDDVSLAVPAHFQRAGDDIVLLWPIPEGQQPDPDLEVPLNPPPISQYPMPIFESQPYDPKPDAPELIAAAALAAFGSSEFAKTVLGGIWGHPPQIDLAAETRLHHLLQELARRKLLHSARDLSDGGIAVALAQAAFPNGIGATVEQDQSLLAHPCFGLFAEPSSTVIVSAARDRLSAIEKTARAHGYFSARIGSTGGSRLEISVDRQLFISASVAELHTIWANALEANLHGEVHA